MGWVCPKCGNETQFWGTVHRTVYLDGNGKIVEENREDEEVTGVSCPCGEKPKWVKEA
jgi:hypothetical protein